MNELNILSKILAIWGWHLTAWMAFFNGIVLLTLDKTPWAAGLFGIFTICEIISLKKKWRLEDASTEEEYGEGC